MRRIALATLLATTASVMPHVALTGPAFAETPADTLVVADKIDDIVSIDPAESFEFSGNDMLNNVYDTLIELDPADLGPLVPGVAESWEVAEDGVTYTFKIAEGRTFHSGNPITANDAAYSIHRAIKLDKTPAFILTQFGFTPDNVEEKVTAVDDTTLQIVTDKPYAPSFFYNCLTAVVASVVDSKLVMENEADGDMGAGFLASNTAGGGAYQLRSFRPSESYILEANADYWRGTPAMNRVFVRHVAEPATQRLLLEQGDIDVARKLTPTDIEGVSGNEDIKVEDTRRGRLMYVAMNQKVEALANPKVQEAIKHLIDYQGMADSFLKGQYVPHQAFLPVGFLGALEEQPFTFDVEKAKALLEESGVGDISLRIFVRNDQDRLEMAQSFQNTLGQAGITAELRTGTGSEILGEYRARNHDIYLGAWGPDYPDPNTNADTFARNPDNSDEAGNTGYLAWRNAWPAEETMAMTEAAVLEKDSDARAAMYEEIQRIHQQSSPFAVMFQLIEQAAMGADVENFEPGGSIHSVFYWPVTKGAE